MDLISHAGPEFGYKLFKSPSRQKIHLSWACTQNTDEVVRSRIEVCYRSVKLREELARRYAIKNPHLIFRTPG